VPATLIGNDQTDYSVKAHDRRQRFTAILFESYNVLLSLSGNAGDPGTGTFFVQFV
jgi:hypothetical protein